VTDRFVLDASVLLSWLFGEAEFMERMSAIVGTLSTKRALVPAIWQMEIGNALVVRERRKLIDTALVRRSLDQLGNLPIDVDFAAATGAFERVVPLARRHQLSVYDATYLELAMRERLPLATLDTALNAAADREGVRQLSVGL
jgi:predicted nucleic acid-binding protein